MNLKDNLKSIDEFLNSEEGQAEMNAWALSHAEKMKLIKSRTVKLNNCSDEQFEYFMQKVFKDNGEEWKDKCYEKGYEPYPTNLMYLVFDCAKNHGKDISNESNSIFHENVWFYRGYYFSILHGQGSHSSIMNQQEWEEWNKR